ncbi:unnamed protein product [Acanthoscelides obtectus]|uniref:Uncharacterized protein n=1 Tax=Acanthoscelides obtectus TaxID=200917 RepID=A0A9P0K3P9_ACAOB|nr:unnamed protein product [Acanthoscelides obtectus]CAK1646705.1 hypothetical protein AOBTE_LOCUS14829 [Acanthoscelides obtectus]
MADKFVDIKELPRKLGLVDRKKTTTNEKFSFRDVRWIQIEEFGITKYRYSFDETENWTIVDIRKQRNLDRREQNEPSLVNVDRSRPIGEKSLTIFRNRLLSYQKILEDFMKT